MMLLERFKQNIFVLPKKFWVRHYIIAFLIFMLMSVITYSSTFFVFSVPTLLLNALLYPFSKCVLYHVENLWYLYVHRVDPTTIYRQIGIGSLLVKVIKSIIIFMFSSIIGLIGVVMFLIVSPKTDVEYEVE